MGVMNKRAAFVLAFAATALLAACGGGGGGASSGGGGGVIPPPSTTPTPSPTPSTGTSNSSTIPVSTAPGNATLPPVGAYTGIISLPAANAATNLVLTASTVLPAGLPPVAGHLKPAKNARTTLSLGTPLLFISITPQANVSFNGTPGFTVSVPAAGAAAAAATYFIALYTGVWSTISGPVSVSGSGSVVFAATSTPVTLTAGVTYTFVLYSSSSVTGGSASPSASPTPTATPTPTAAPLSGSNVACTSFGTTTASIGVLPQTRELRRLPARAGTLRYVPGQIEVLYRSELPSMRTPRSATMMRTLNFSQTGQVLQVFAVDDAQVDATISALRNDPNVVSASRVALRYPSSSVRYLTNDPYFSEPLASNPGTGYAQPGPPCFEAQNVPGQWDMHQVGLDFAFGYSQAGSSVVNANALGNPSVTIAIIDTGADTTLKELSGKIVHQGCFVTGQPAANSCASATDITDYNGHGTDVSGIAAADAGNNYGFVGDGGNVSLMVYRIFPKGPPGGCDSNPTSSLCGASAVDEASAIADAVANHANVISMSLGASTADSSEQAAVANAIAAGVTVVAASGNETSSALDYPAGYPGVIAVGATGIVDSIPNGDSATASSAGETVAGYSNYDAIHPTTWGIVAPGGNPSQVTPAGCASGSGDCDYLHWIENIYSTSALFPSTQPYACTTDAAHSLFGETGDCRVLIAGTSMATPHVAGAVGLLLSVRSGLSPAQVAAALQASAHNIGDPHQGYGRLNVYKLIANALGDTSVPGP